MSATGWPEFTKIEDLESLRGLLGSVATNELVRTHGLLTQEGVTHILKLCKALWIHSGDPKAPHAGLTSGKCSNGFVDVLRALRYTNVCDILAYHMVHALEAKIYEIENDENASRKEYIEIDWVIGSDHAGADFSHDVARWFGAQHDFTEKAGIDGKQQAWKRFVVHRDQAVLQVEELMTTAGTLLAVREGIRRDNPYLVTFAPVVGVLVHRSDVYEIEGAPVVYLAHYDIESWWPDKCPLCAQGSKRISEPKKNWDELTGL